MANTYTLERTQWVDRPLEEVFAFFSDAHNLEALTPKFLNFRILTESPLDMRAGTLIEYRIRLMGIPLYWRTLIEEWNPPHSFTDIQLKGPYRLWRHTHAFTPVDGGTLCTDRVDYQLPLGRLGTIANSLWVKHTLAQIFDYRHEQIEQILSGQGSRATEDDSA